MTKIYIIDVELDVDIAEIINQDISNLSADVEQQIQAAASAAQLAKDLSSKRKRPSSPPPDSNYNLFIQRMREAGEQGFTSEEMLQHGSALGSNLAALLSRMRAAFKKTGAKVDIQKIDGKPVRYRLIDREIVTEGLSIGDV